jgi:hypothetical protein
MSTPRKATPPRDLGVAGRDLFRRLTDRWKFEPWEVPGLLRVCRAVDREARLEAIIREQGDVVPGAQGLDRMNPALAELRQVQLSIVRLVEALALPGDTNATKPRTSSTSRRASIAANARWGRVHEMRENGALPEASPVSRSHGA